MMFNIRVSSIAFMVLLIGCGTGEPVSAPEEQPESPDEPVLVRLEVELEEFEDLNAEEYRLFVRNRSRLQDRFAQLSHSSPDEHFTDFDEEEKDPRQGFRIQILSTRDVALADTTRAEFEEWVQDRFAEYIPNSYIHYRQPYYRVRVGDFHDRERAIELSRLVQRRYPEAWIIHDRVNPNRVAADTVEFRFRESVELERLPAMSTPDVEEESDEESSTR